MKKARSQAGSFLARSTSSRARSRSLTYDAPHPVGPTGGNVPPPTCSGTVVGLYHTHAAYAPGYSNENFTDLNTLLNNSWDGYLGTPRGVIKKFNCTTVATKNLPYPKKCK
jgi:hypothetical protein